MSDELNQSTAEEIQAKIGAALKTFNVFHAQVLVAMHIRPSTTKGGIILTDKTRNEDTFQGKAGLVLKTGPLAFISDKSHDFTGSRAMEGEWVVFRTSDGFMLKINGVHCRLLEDVAIRGVIHDPLIIY